MFCKLLPILVPIFLLTTGCTSIHRSGPNSSLNITIDSPMRAKIDVDISKKLVGYASGGYLFHLLRVSGDNRFIDNIRFNGKDPGMLSFFSKTMEVKAAAAYNAMRTTDADVLVNPQYVIEENHWNPVYKLIKVKVTGYAGKLATIRNQ